MSSVLKTGGGSTSTVYFPSDDTSAKIEDSSCNIRGIGPGPQRALVSRRQSVSSHKNIVRQLESVVHDTNTYRQSVSNHNDIVRQLESVVHDTNTYRSVDKYTRVNHDGWAFSKGYEGMGYAEHNAEKDSFYGEFDVVGGAVAGTTNTSTYNGSSRIAAGIIEDIDPTQRINEKLKDSQDGLETIRHAEVTRADAAYAQLQHRFM